MQTDSTRRVRTSFASLTRQAERFSERFYEVLFERAPELRPMFTGPLAEQRRKFVDMLAAIVDALDEPARAHAMFAALGRRHAGYGVEERDYDAVGGALFATLRESLGDTFDEGLEAAWGEVYGELAETMIAAQRAATGSASR